MLTRTRLPLRAEKTVTARRVKLMMMCHRSQSSTNPLVNQPTGPSVDMSNKTPLDFFKLLVTDTMLDGIVEQTNLDAQQFMDATSLPPHSRVHGWSKEAHTRPELKKFLAMIVNFPHIEDYWATSWPYSTPTFSKVYTNFAV